MRHSDDIAKRAIADCLAKASQHPDDPQAQIELFGALRAFNRNEEAKKLAAILEQKFAQNADVQIQLGAYYLENDRPAEADAKFQLALDLAPDKPWIRNAVARGYLAKGDLAKAGKVVASMPMPPSGEDGRVVRGLADAYQDRGQHKEALGLYRMALAGAAVLGLDKEFRRRAKVSEKALGVHKTMLPRVSRVPRRVAIWAAVIGLAVLGALGVDLYLSTSQPLHMFNHLTGPVTIKIDDGTEHRLASGEWREIRLGEGKHRALITREGAPDETVDLSIKNTFFGRFFGDSVFILNPGGAATFLWERITYTTKGEPNIEPRIRIYFGKSFLTFRNIDYIFEDAPEELTTESEASRITKTHLMVLEGGPCAALGWFPEGASGSKLMDFAEHHLKLNPADDALADTYYAIGSGHDQLKRCREFLRQGLAHRPIRTCWHALYQQACRMSGAEGVLIPMYDRLLKENPGNSTLLYLRGRIDMSSAVSMDHYRRAIAADPKNPDPWIATAFELQSRGDFAGARKACTTAVGLKPDDPEALEALFQARLALEEYDALEKELRAQQRGSPLDLTLQRKLLLVRAAQGGLKRTANAHQAYVRAVRAGMSDDPLELIPSSQIMLLYLQGDLRGVLRVAGRRKGAEWASWTRFEASLELGDPGRAAKMLDSSAGSFDAYDYLLLSLAYRQKGAQAEAQKWREKALDMFSKGTIVDKQVARLLGAGDKLRLEDVDDFGLVPFNKTQLLVALAADCPSKRRELLARARKLNYNLLAPHRFLKSVMAALEK